MMHGLRPVGPHFLFRQHTVADAQHGLQVGRQALHHPPMSAAQMRQRRVQHLVHHDPITLQLAIRDVATDADAHAPPGRSAVRHRFGGHCGFGSAPVGSEPGTRRSSRPPSSPRVEPTPRGAAPAPRPPCPSRWSAWRRGTSIVRPPGSGSGSDPSCAAVRPAHGAGAAPPSGACW